MKTIISITLSLFMFIQLNAQFKQSPLEYKYDALQPSVDAQTMEIHYSKHHAGYVKKLNAAIEKEGIKETDILKIFANMSKYPTSVRNSGGGHYNHELFWKNLSPKSTMPSKELKKAIEKKFGSMEKFMAEFNSKTASVFGSGWGWLIVNSKGELQITTTPNQDNPLMDVVEVNGTPILAIDVWEHAYYLNYQNKRGDYLSSIWNVINWDEVSERYKEATK